MARLRGFVVPALLAGGCDPELVSERGDFALSFPDLWSRSFGAWPEPRRVAEGTRLCPELTCNACPEGQSCQGAAITALGAVEPDGACFVAVGSGEVVWSVAAPCGAAGQEPDQARLEVVALADLEAVPVQELDQLVQDRPDALRTGAAWSTATDAPIRVIEGSQVKIDVELRAPDGGAVLYRGGEVRWSTVSGRAPVTYPSAALELVTFADTVAEASFQLGDVSWPLGQVVGVPASAARSLELAAAFEPGLGTGLVRALARDAEGAPVVGLPVTWSRVRGDLAVEPTAPNQDHAWLEDGCVAPEERGGPRSLEVRAERGGLSAAVSLRWEGVADEPDPAWTPSERCDDAGAGCGCAGGGQGGLALLAVLLLRRRRRLAGVASVALLAPACREPPSLEAAVSRELGAFAWDPRIAGRDGGYSARVGDRIVWVFGDTGASKAPGALPGFLNNTSCTTPDLDARDGLFPLVENLEDGYPLEFIPLTEDEVAYELAHNSPSCDEDCEGVALWPGPVIPDPARGRVLVFYSKLLQRPGFLNITVLGTSLAVWADELPTRAERPVIDPESDEPTLLFRAGEPELAAAAFAEGDQLFAYTCEGEGWDKPCRLARAPLADPLRRERWEFYAGDGAWSADFRRGEELFQGAPIMSVSPKRGGYVAVYVESGGTDIVLRTAPAPEGPWSDEGVVHRPLRPTREPLIYGGLLHPELGRADGSIDFLTYYLDTSGTIQLVEVEWRP